MTDIEKILDECGWPALQLPLFSGNVIISREAIYAPTTDAKIALIDAADAEFPSVRDVEATE